MWWICPECRSLYREKIDTCERDGMQVVEVNAQGGRARYPLLERVIENRYELIGGLGQGGLGTVYLARHLKLDQLFALKFLDLENVGIDVDKGTVKEYQNDFIKEARIAAFIRHDSVVKVSDFGEYEKLPYLVMDYVPGPSLLGMITERRRFTMPEAVNIARRIGEALNAFHERKLVHRDLKPANVIMDPRGNGQLTLVDLGLVKDVSGPAGRLSTHPMALRGTPGYLAPEQVPSWVLSGQGIELPGAKKVVDARADIYALGVIFYEMLAGVSPYPDGSNTSIIVYACTKPPLPLSGVNPPVRVTAGLEALIYRCMSRNPDDRPEDAAAFIRELDALNAAPIDKKSWPVILPDSPNAPQPISQGPRHSAPIHTAFTDPRSRRSDGFNSTSAVTQAVDIIDDGMGQHDAFGGTEDATMEFGPDESLDSLLDAGGHLNETHTFDGSADFMVTRIDTLNPDGSLGSSNQHSRPAGTPGKAGGQKWLLVALPLVAVLAGAVVWSVRTAAQSPSDGPKSTVSQSQQEPGPRIKIEKTRVAPAVKTNGAPIAQPILPATDVKASPRNSAPSVNTSASKPVGQPAKTTPNPTAPIKQVKVEPQQQTPTQPSARADDTQRTKRTRPRRKAQPSQTNRASTPRGRQKKTRDKGRGPKSATLSAPALNALFRRANSAVAAGRYGECVKAFERWIRSAGRKHPDFSTAQGRLIYCKTESGK